MTRALLVGSGAGLIEVAQKITEYGHSLTVLGGKKNDPCHEIADESILVDYSDLTSSLEATQDKEFDFVIPGSNDIAYETASIIADRLHIKSFDPQRSITRLHNKKKFRSLLQELGLNQPQTYTKMDFAPKNRSLMNGKFLIVKPELSFSGKGISIVQNERALIDAMTTASQVSRNKKCLIEDYIEGQLYSVSTFLNNGEIYFHAFANEYCTVNPFAVNASTTPSDLKKDIKENVLGSVKKITKHLGLLNGLLHIQFIVDCFDQVYLIESMRRLIGDFYAKKIMHSAGIDYYDFYLRPYLNLDYDENLVVAKPKSVSRQIIAGSENFNFEGLTNRENLNILEYIPLAKSGDAITKFPDGKAGIVFFENTSADIDVGSEFLVRRRVEYGRDW